MQKITPSGEGLLLSFPPGTSIINREGKECGTVKNAAKWAALWALLVLLPAGCAGGEADSSQPRQLGEEISTAWFTFSVEEAACTQEYQGYSAQQGETLVVVELSLRSRYDQAIPMFDTDFHYSMNINSGEVHILLGPTKLLTNLFLGCFKIFSGVSY